MNVSSASAMVNVLNEGRVQREKAADERSAARLRDAKSAVATLKQMNTDASDQKKAAAKQRVDQLKARLQMLKMSSPVDPKVLAQLARELKSAVSSYAGAGGSAGDLGVTATATASTPSADTGAAQAESGADAGAAQSVATGVETEQAGDPQQDAAGSPDNPYQRMAQDAEIKLADASRRGAASQADRDFLTDVRGLTNQIKALAKQATASKADPVERRDAEAAEKAAADALKTIEDAGKDLRVGGIFLTV
ncbi:hypothetical protein EGY25_08120 [Brevundimonas intermedia]|uniref:Uncharacterized protein n=1 Tax=Brevundimonas intermedia TaxID=74315 RepID=A0A4Y9RSZ8_9CAUL|nr:hypothetical protein [Brevundimonas intermedia]TFW12012.1 hypothetical protein EGY25_08120 [Brevundimonas intermedia]